VDLITGMSNAVITVDASWIKHSRPANVLGIDTRLLAPEELFRYVYPSQSDFVPVSLWQDLIGRLKEAVSHPDPKQTFRGSLIDDRMFAIDLKEWGLDNVLQRKRAAREPMIAIAKESDCISA
jgi:hypothetical protein